MDKMLDLHEPDHLPDIPPYLHMTQHVYSSANYTKPGQYVKCFHNPEKVQILHNHFPLGVFWRGLHLLPRGHLLGAPAVLQAALRQHSQEVLQE